MGVLNTILREKKQFLQPVLDLTFWIICGIAFYFWSRFVITRGNNLPIAYDGLDAFNQAAVFGAKDILVDYLIFLLIAYIFFFLFALCVYIITHYLKWCLVLKKQPTLKGIKHFALLACVYATPLYALFSVLFFKLKAEGALFFVLLYLPLMYFITQAKAGVVLTSSFKKGILLVRIKWRGVLIFVLAILGAILLNFLFASATTQQFTFVITLVYLVSSPFFRYYFTKFQLTSLKKGKNHG